MANVLMIPVLVGKALALVGSMKTTTKSSVNLQGSVAALSVFDQVTFFSHSSFRPRTPGMSWPRTVPFPVKTYAVNVAL